jgi:hypothetical protein
LEQLDRKLKVTFPSLPFEKLLPFMNATATMQLLLHFESRMLVNVNGTSKEVAKA